MSTKCGEIYYQQNQKWCYLCVFCGKSTQNHDEFQEHFDKHLNECKDIQDFVTKDVNNSDPRNEVFCGPQMSSDEKTNNEDLAIGIDVNHEEGCKLSNLEIYGDRIKKRKLSDDSETSSKSNWDFSLPSSNSKRPYKPRNKAFFCSYCKRSFGRRNAYNTHLNIHTGAKPHQCEICGRQFRAVTTLQRHLTTHKQQKFICKHCNKSFTHRVALVSHEIRHTQKRNESCDLCEKNFYTSNQLDTHKRRVHNKANEILPFACDLCPKRYRNASMLSTHKFRKHLRTAKYQCEKCDKKFIDLHRLDEHKNIHFDSEFSTQYISLEKSDC